MEDQKHKREMEIEELKKKLDGENENKDKWEEDKRNWEKEMEKLKTALAEERKNKVTIRSSDE